ncbi:hypothetical protein [Crucivirus-534]|nr:hypothetical protein [Crucivirus-534]
MMFQHTREDPERLWDFGMDELKLVDLVTTSVAVIIGKNGIEETSPVQRGDFQHDWDGLQREIVTSPRQLLYQDKWWIDKEFVWKQLPCTFREIQRLWATFTVESVYRHDLDHGFRDDKCWIVYRLYNHNGLINRAENLFNSWNCSE